MEPVTVILCIHLLLLTCMGSSYRLSIHTKVTLLRHSQKAVSDYN